MRQGFVVSARFDSMKRHYESLHAQVRVGSNGPQGCVLPPVSAFLLCICRYTAHEGCLGLMHKHVIQFLPQRLFLVAAFIGPVFRVKPGCCSCQDRTEDHLAHLIWGFMALTHVIAVFPHTNDLVNFEALRRRNVLRLAITAVAVITTAALCYYS